MNRLAKLGFTQSYTYFTWRTNKDEIIAYMEELTKGESAKFFRPNFWPNTPDILPYDLQNTGSEHHAVRFVLAATLSASYGMYGPVYDLAVSAPYPNKEEYLDSEKYEIRHWDWESMTPLRKLIQAVNRIRKSEKALQYTHQIQFCTTDNPMLIAYFKQSPDGDHRILCIVNLDPVHAQSGFVTLPEHLIPAAGSWLTVTDLLNGESYHWDKASNYVRLDPASFPAHILRC
jgi:starch synthase (maltosyl-transferring)